MEWLLYCYFREIHYLIRQKLWIQSSRQARYDNCLLTDYLRCGYASTFFKVDVHCRVIIFYLLSCVEFVCVNKIETMYKRSRVNLKVKTRSPFMLSRDTSHIASVLFLRHEIKLRGSGNPPLGNSLGLVYWGFWSLSCLRFHAGEIELLRGERKTWIWLHGKRPCKIARLT